MPDTSIFRGCIPALMTPCSRDGTPNFDALVSTAQSLIADGMRAVVYCGSMGDWPLLSDKQRQEGVRRLVETGVPVVVGTGAQSPQRAASHAAHAKKVGAAGLLIIPRLMARASSSAAQHAHFSGVLNAGGDLPAVIYNSPYLWLRDKGRPVLRSAARAYESYRLEGIRRSEFADACRRIHHER